MEADLKKIIHLIILFTIFLLAGCGVVSRTMHPNYNIKFYLNLHRNLVVFGPTGAKVYYSIDSETEEFIGYVNDGKTTANIDAARTGFDEFSSWRTMDSRDEKLDDLFIKVREASQANISIRLNYSNKDYYTYVECIYGFGCGNTYKAFSDLPDVKRVVDESDATDMNFSQNYKYSIYYRDLVVDFNEQLNKK